MAWYKTGTISVSGVTVTGTGTNWTDNKMGIGPGQALLIPAAGTVKMYEILRVDSATKITLTSSAGTLAAGQAYAIMNFYTDSVPDFARRLSAQLSYYQSQMDGWQQIMTGTGNVTLQAPDGTQVTISSFKKLTDDTAVKLDKNQNLNDLQNKATARANLGLGSAALRDAFSGSGDILSLGDFGLGCGTFYPGVAIPASPGAPANGEQLVMNGWWSAPGASGVSYYNNFAPVMCMTRGANQIAQLQIGGSGIMAARFREGSTISPWAIQYSTANTTKASDGTLKAASPVARIVKSQDECQRPDIDETGFAWCGSGTANAEAEGINISRLDVGVYTLTGSAGLASEGWQLLPPMDPGGMGELGVVEAEETESGGITIRLYKRKYMLDEEGDIVKTKGAPIDVPANSWIDIRLDMPESSAWNLRQATAQKEMEEAERLSQQDQPDTQS